jgi:hypothetical protein
MAYNLDDKTAIFAHVRLMARELDFLDNEIDQMLMTDSANSAHYVKIHKYPIYFFSLHFELTSFFGSMRWVDKETAYAFTNYGTLKFSQTKYHLPGRWRRTGGKRTPLA